MTKDMQIGFPGGSRVQAQYKGFTIDTDQPAHGGGGGSAPAPFDYFIASIGTCAGFYVLKFLEQRSLPTEGVRVTLSTKKDRERKRISDVVVRIELPDEFPQKYRQALMRAVDLCSVKQHVLEPPRFTTEVSIGCEVAAGV